MLGGAILGSLGVIAGIWADKFDQLAAFQNFLIMPLTMLSGVFYSIHSLPRFWQDVSHFNPFFFMIDGFRYGFFGQSDTSPWLRSASWACVSSCSRRSPWRCSRAVTSCVRKGFQMFEASEVKRLIEQGLPCELVVIEGEDGRAFPRHRRQRRLRGQDEGAPAPGETATLGRLMGNEIHAPCSCRPSPRAVGRRPRRTRDVSRAWTTC